MHKSALILVLVWKWHRICGAHLILSTSDLRSVQLHVTRHLGRLRIRLHLLLRLRSHRLLTALVRSSLCVHIHITALALTLTLSSVGDALPVQAVPLVAVLDVIEFAPSFGKNLSCRVSMLDQFCRHSLARLLARVDLLDLCCVFLTAHEALLQGSHDLVPVFTKLFAVGRHVWYRIHLERLDEVLSPK